MTELLTPTQGTSPVPGPESRPGAPNRPSSSSASGQRPSEAALRAALEQADGMRTEANGRTIEVSFNSDLNRLILKLKSNTGEVIRQVPPEDYVRFLTRLDEMVGVLFDHKT